MNFRGKAIKALFLAAVLSGCSSYKQQVRDARMAKNKSQDHIAAYNGLETLYDTRRDIYIDSGICYPAIRSEKTRKPRTRICTQKSIQLKIIYNFD